MKLAELNLPNPGELAWAGKLNNAIKALQSEMESLHGDQQAAINNLSSLQGDQQAAINNLSSLLETIRNVTDPTFQQALQALLEPIIEDIAAGVIASDPTLVQAAIDAVNNALSSILSLSKSVHLESGRWVWDGPNGAGATHYILRVDGRWRTAATPFPVPSASAPAITWI